MVFKTPGESGITHFQWMRMHLAYPLTVCFWDAEFAGFVAVGFSEEVPRTTTTT
jgi:hypothetical protein